MSQMSSLTVASFRRTEEPPPTGDIRRDGGRLSRRELVVKGGDDGCDLRHCFRGERARASKQFLKQVLPARQRTLSVLLIAL